jgi:hypothetical protein
MAQLNFVKVRMQCDGCGAAKAAPPKQCPAQGPREPAGGHGWGCRLPAPPGPVWRPLALLGARLLGRSKPRLQRRHPIAAIVRATASGLTHYGLGYGLTLVGRHHPVRYAHGRLQGVGVQFGKGHSLEVCHSATDHRDERRRASTRQSFSPPPCGCPG